MLPEEILYAYIVAVLCRLKSLFCHTMNQVRLHKYLGCVLMKHISSEEEKPTARHNELEASYQATLVFEKVT